MHKISSQFLSTFKNILIKLWCTYRKYTNLRVWLTELSQSEETYVTTIKLRNESLPGSQKCCWYSLPSHSHLLKGNHYPDYKNCSLALALSILKCFVSGIIYYVLLCVWLVSLNVFVIFIQVYMVVPSFTFKFNSLYPFDHW